MAFFLSHWLVSDFATFIYTLKRQLHCHSFLAKTAPEKELSVVKITIELSTSSLQQLY